LARISYKERVIVEERCCGDVWSMRRIAEKLQRSVSAISREIDRNLTNGSVYVVFFISFSYTIKWEKL